MNEKKSSVGGIITVVIIAFALIMLFSSTFVVNKGEYAVVKQFGKVVQIYDEPGLKFKVPFIHSVDTLPNKELIHDLPDLQNVYVYDIFTGELVTIQTALNRLYDYARPGALTADEWDELGLSAVEYDHWMMHHVPAGLTAVQYDTEGRFILGRRIIQKLRSPMTGALVDRRIVLAEQDNINKEVNCWTVDEWNNALTVDQLEELAWTAFDLDWHSNRLEVA